MGYVTYALQECFRKKQARNKIKQLSELNSDQLSLLYTTILHGTYQSGLFCIDDLPLINEILKDEIKNFK